MSIERRITKSGERRYDVRLRGPDGRVHNRTFRTRKDAERYEREQNVAKDRGLYVDPIGGMRFFGSWATEWLANDAAKSPGARATDTSIIRSCLLPRLEHRRLGSISPLDIQRLVSTWISDAAPRTVRRRYATLSAIFKAAVDAELIGRSPCRGVRLPPVQPAKVRVVTPEEVNRLAAELPERYRPAVYLGAMLGLRIGEVAGLRVGRLDLLGRTLTIAESVGEANGRLFSKDPKSAAGRRVLPLPTPLVEMLAAHMAAAGLTAADADEYLFTAPAGGPLRPPHFRARVWRPACRRAGLGGLGFHDLRRSTATVLVASGVSVRDAQEMLGHSDPRLTLAVYAQATDLGKRVAVDALAQHFAPDSIGSPISDESGTKDLGA